MLPTFFHNLFNILFRFPDKKHRWVYFVWAGFLLVAGALIWGWFLDWGRSPFGYSDWMSITLPRLTVLKDAVVRWVFPLHIFDKHALNNMTDRYLAIPDVFFSPQLLLLKWMQLNTFIVFDYLMLYVIGFAGLLIFSWQKRLSVFAFTVFWGLFNFNGHIVDHLSIGHFTWLGYFLLPWVLILVFDLIEKRQGWRWVVYTSVVLTAMLLQGDYHLYVYCLFLLVFLIPFAWRNFWPITGAGIFTVLLSGFRLAPTMTSLGKISNMVHYYGGFPYFANILEGMVSAGNPAQKITDPALNVPIGVWEVSLYVGLIGAIFLLYFGLVRVYQNRTNPDHHAVLLFPIGVFTLLSLDWLYQLIFNALPIPPINGERVPSRIMGLALVLILALAVQEFQHWSERLEPSVPFTLLGLGSALVTLHDLEQNLHVWSIHSMTDLITPSQADKLLWYLDNHNDPPYILSLKIGAAISFGTILVLGFLYGRDWWLRRRKAVSR